MASVVIDAGHGGSDPGAVYNGRQEKDDVLNLAMAVGDILENSGVEVFYTRTGDVFATPFEKAMAANATGADYLVSIHRNSSLNPNQYSGVQTLVFRDNGIRSTLARNINNELVALGFRDAGIVERPNLAILKRSKMPAALVEVGFINNDMDNEKFDRQFDEIAKGIADGILSTVYGGQGDTSENVINEEEDENYDYNLPGNYSQYEYEDEYDRRRPRPEGPGMMRPERLYRVQVGAYSNRDSADRLLNSLLAEGFPAFIIMDDGLYKVQVGAYRNLSNAISMENKLRTYRYNTYITT